MISIIGFPTDKNSSFQKGAALAPSIIIDAFNSNSTNTLLIFGGWNETLVTIPTCSPFKLTGLPVFNPPELL